MLPPSLFLTLSFNTPNIARNAFRPIRLMRHSKLNSDTVVFRMFSAILIALKHGVEKFHTHQCPSPLVDDWAVSGSLNQLCAHPIETSYDREGKGREIFFEPFPPRTATKVSVGWAHGQFELALCPSYRNVLCDPKTKKE